MMVMYLKSMVMKDGVCEITLTSPRGEVDIIKFNFIRSILFYKESDFFEEISMYSKKIITLNSGNSSSLFQILKNPLSENFHKGRFIRDDPMYFGVWTPDECFEVMCFEYPIIDL